MRKRNTALKLALIGNPNSGKSSLFNALTGLNQKISNYPGVTVEKKSGVLKLPDQEIELIDFPGIYSLYPNSKDERIVVEILTNPQDINYPDGIIYVATGMELEKHFLLITQLRELSVPMIMCLSMSDISKKKGIQYDTEQLSEYLDLPVIEISSTEGTNLDRLKELLKVFQSKIINQPWKNAYQKSNTEQKICEIPEYGEKNGSSYQRLLLSHHHQWLGHLSAATRINIAARIGNTDFNSLKSQIHETLCRYNSFTPIIKKARIDKSNKYRPQTEWIDNLIVHRFFGPFLFLFLMFLVFQAIYSWAEAPMNWIENAFSILASYAKETLPPGWLTDLFADGIIAGLGGIIVFVPQIAILFTLIGIMEESGYMSRVVFMFDGLMQKFGLNGRSLVSLVSSGACAIPAIMSTRTIANHRERLLTIMVAPLISCSARIPVYTVLVAFIVPSKKLFGIINTQGLAFMGLYLIGAFTALIASFVFKFFIRTEEKSYLMIELPQYKAPVFKNLLIGIRDRVESFVVEAGKIIMLVSVLLWFLASYGPPEKMKIAEELSITESIDNKLSNKEYEDLLASKRIEASYAGIMGKAIEPAIQPLGFDWKIGIALITSFAAREIFVGTMATIYSVGSADDELTVRQKMEKEINPKTGNKRYDFATALSLLMFYVFAMQCMSTLAVTRKETNSWKWPAIQFVYMGILAYISSFIVYTIFS